MPVKLVTTIANGKSGLQAYAVLGFVVLPVPDEAEPESPTFAEWIPLRRFLSPVRHGRANLRAVARMDARGAAVLEGAVALRLSGGMKSKGVILVESGKVSVLIGMTGMTAQGEHRVPAWKLEEEDMELLGIEV